MTSETNGNIFVAIINEFQSDDKRSRFNKLVRSKSTQEHEIEKGSHGSTLNHQKTLSRLQFGKRKSPAISIKSK